MSLKKVIPFVFALCLALPGLGWAVPSAPTGLATGVLMPSNSATLSWTEDTAVLNWLIYINGGLVYTPIRSDTQLSGTVRTYGMINLPKASTLVITMKASNNSGTSSTSAAVTMTGSVVPFTYVMPVPGSSFPSSSGSETHTTTTLSNTVAETTILAAGGIGVLWDIDSISVINTDAAAGTRIDFRSTTGGSVVYSMGAASGYGGFVFCPQVALPQDVANGNWTAQCSVSATAVRVNVLAHQRK